jgi:hypothetical protein
MERQRGQRARGRHQQAPLVFHDGLDLAEQRHIELVGAREIEQLRFAGGIAGLADVEPPAEGGNLLRDRIRTERNPLPVEPVARQRDRIAVLVGNGEQHHRLVTREQRLDFPCLQRQRIRQRGIIREFSREGFLQAGALGRDGGDPLAAALRGGGIALALS